MSYPDAVAEGWRDERKRLDGQVSDLLKQVRSLQTQLTQTERFWTDLANDVLDHAPDCWDSDESIDHIAVEYVRALEEISELAIGRMPMRGDEPRVMLGVPDWADRAVIERDEDRGIDGDPFGQVRYDADGRGWHIRQVA
jgi:hypothetical protein